MRVPQPKLTEALDSLGLYGWNEAKQTWEHADRGLRRDEVYRELGAADLNADGHLDLVTFSLESGAVEQERIDVDLAETVRAIADDAQFEAAGKGRRVELTRCDACVTHGVPSLIRSAIDNVVRNAIDFTPENGTIEIALAAGGDGTATISVRDHGPGVPPEALSRIFEPFFRAVSSGSRTRSGTGLGLAITDRAVRLHRGAIEATNAEGGGLLMRITLPLHNR